MSAAEARVVSGADDIGRIRGWVGLHWKFRPALGAVFSGQIINLLALAAPFNVQRPATFVAELGTRRVGVVAEGARAETKDHGQHLNGKTTTAQIAFREETLLSKKEDGTDIKRTLKRMKCNLRA